MTEMQFHSSAGFLQVYPSVSQKLCRVPVHSRQVVLMIGYALTCLAHFGEYLTSNIDRRKRRHNRRDDLTCIRASSPVNGRAHKLVESDVYDSTIEPRDFGPNDFLRCHEQLYGAR